MAKQKKRPWPCRLADNGRIAPCFALDECLEMDGQGTRHQGIKIQTLINMKTGSFSRNIVSIKSGNHSKKGLTVNYCPFCGEPLLKEVAAEKEAA